MLVSNDRKKLGVASEHYGGGKRRAAFRRGTAPARFPADAMFRFNRGAPRPARLFIKVTHRLPLSEKCSHGIFICLSETD
jgi:hypothetical protein